MTTTGKRVRLTADTFYILSLLPKLDRLMLAVRKNGFLYERLGFVDSVEEMDGTVKVSGPGHDAEINIAALDNVEYDTCNEMRGKIYPRLDFIGKDGEIAFSVVGLEGLEPFEQLLSTEEATQVDKKPRAASDGEEPDLEADPAGPYLNSLPGTGDVTVRVTTNAVTQAWTGEVEKVLPMGGCFNIITKTFHLHLPGGILAGWEEDGARHHAKLPGGEPGGLTVELQP
ncbi:hypothetical protein FMN50_22465 [Rhodobacterales bacterium]|nr:hypothetical protein FMN50_22465 [Rhodobacterales bacterium]